MFGLIITIICFIAIAILSFLFFSELIGIIPYVLGLIATIVLWFVLLIKKGERILADKQSDIWDTIDSHLASKAFNPTSKIEVIGTVESSKKDFKLPSLVISVDMIGKRFAFTRFVSDHLHTEFLAFDNITGGEIIIGGKSSSTISSGVGSAAYGVGVGIGTSSSSTIIHSLEYRFAINDILNPFYTIGFFEREVCESAPIYRHYLECASKLDVLVKSIVEKTAE